MLTDTKIDYTVLETVNRASIDKVDILEITNKHCRAKLSLFGAHLLSFIPQRDQRERLWLSSAAIFDKSKAIRGGIPVCWPWFADIYPEHHNDESNSQSLRASGDYPAHGFVRTQDWDVSAISESEEETKITLHPSKLGLFGFEKSLNVEIEFTFAEKCTVKLSSQNLSSIPQSITAALHSYLNVPSIDTLELHGIEGKFIDKLEDSRLFDSPAHYRIEQEVDRIHLVDDSNKMEKVSVSFDERTTSNVANLSVAHTGHDSVIIWNPWIDKSAKMADMPPGGYRNMLCIEAAISSPHCIAPNERHVLEQIID